MSARTALRQHLVTAAPSFGGRIFEPSTAMPTTQYPFLVITGGAEDTGEVWSNIVEPFQLWPYVAPVTPTSEPTPYNMLDNLVGELQAALGGRDGYWFADNGVPYTAWWVGGAGADFQDPQWQGAVTRPQRVEVASLAWLMLSHDVLIALRAWTTATLPALVTNPGATPPSDADPWAFWRFVSLPVPGEPLTFDLTWQTATVAAHVVAPTPAARMGTAALLAQELGRAGAVEPPTIAMPDGSWLQVHGVRANPDANPRTQGQLQVEVWYALPLDAVPPPADGVFGSAVLTWAEEEGDVGPTVIVTAPSP